MEKAELAAKMQENQAWVEGKKVKIDFGDAGAFRQLDFLRQLLADGRRVVAGEADQFAREVQLEAAAQLLGDALNGGGCILCNQRARAR